MMRSWNLKADAEGGRERHVEITSRGTELVEMNEELRAFRRYTARSPFATIGALIPVTTAVHDADERAVVAVADRFGLERSVRS
jgi:hypothetical protein